MWSNHAQTHTYKENYNRKCHSSALYPKTFLSKGKSQNFSHFCYCFASKMRKFLATAFEFVYALNAFYFNNKRSTILLLFSDLKKPLQYTHSSQDQTTNSEFPILRFSSWSSFRQVFPKFRVIQIQPNRGPHWF